MRATPRLVAAAAVVQRLGCLLVVLVSPTCSGTEANEERCLSSQEPFCNREGVLCVSIYGDGGSWGAISTSWYPHAVPLPRSEVRSRAATVLSYASQKKKNHD